MSVKVFIDGNEKELNLMHIRQEVLKLGKPVLVVPVYHQVNLYIGDVYIGNIQPTYPDETLREVQVLAIMSALNAGIPTKRMFTLGGE